MSLKVAVTIQFTDEEDKPAEGLRVDLHTSFGFLGEEETDENGRVYFEGVEAWTTYELWVDHKEFGALGVSGGDETFQYRYSGD